LFFDSSKLLFQLVSDSEWKIHAQTNVDIGLFGLAFLCDHRSMKLAVSVLEGLFVGRLISFVRFFSAVYGTPPFARTRKTQPACRPRARYFDRAD
jgi:hypothetical protein